MYIHSNNIIRPQNNTPFINATFKAEKYNAVTLLQFLNTLSVSIQMIYYLSAFVQEIGWAGRDLKPAEFRPEGQRQTDVR